MLPLTAAEQSAVAAHVPLLKAVARRLASKLPRFVQPGDLESAGVTGLVEALRCFDASRGIKFDTFAKFRIHGSMLDWIREIDPVPRSMRLKEAAGGKAAPKTFSASLPLHEDNDRSPLDVIPDKRWKPDPEAADPWLTG